MKHKNKKSSQKAKHVWFIPLRWSYLPVSWQGRLLYIPYIAYLVATFILVDTSTNSFTGILVGVVPLWVAGAVIMQWIASHKS